MLSGPLLMSLIPGVVILLVTWWFKKMNFSLFVRIIPGVLTVIAAIILFYIGFVNIRGFEGAAYGILAFFLVIFAIISFLLAKKKDVKAS
ncbi:YesK family protein [Lentibacillus amyloliquefaciens]|nr:YesK family protein [Lentibacillus amyloliquefaciens]